MIISLSIVFIIFSVVDFLVIKLNSKNKEFEDQEQLKFISGRIINGKHFPNKERDK